MAFAHRAYRRTRCGRAVLQSARSKRTHGHAFLSGYDGGLHVHPDRSRAHALIYPVSHVDDPLSASADPAAPHKRSRILC